VPTNENILLFLSSDSPSVSLPKRPKLHERFLQHEENLEVQVNILIIPWHQNFHSQHGSLKITKNNSTRIVPIATQDINPFPNIPLNIARGINYLPPRFHIVEIMERK